ncbi:DUF2878 domain-containing protein [Pseudidiomarina insulisalsae]|uniref:DUF2878 domain-containing protein n=1 Tax=Pseudidiomarina insulisalsae TaxID=575789 RepID=A0A432YMV0_9GAMM|nr:DUF2878 domain-containing protein [Pseudidiomarina insulisalsae]RUO62263.1 hypothetical protein CWI71_05285 [Pseudidiomarina insulisalsae]
MSLSISNWLAKQNLRRIIGLLWFDLVWFCTVAGRNDWLWLAVPMILVQIYISSKRPGFSWLLFGKLLAMGLVLESFVAASAILDFTGGWLPLWLIGLWLGFAAMVTTTLDWLAGRYVIAGLIGLGSGPLTYAIGVRLGAAELLVSEWVMWLTYGLLWASYMAVFAWLMERDKEVQYEHA